MLSELFLLLELKAAALKSLQSCPTLCDPIDSPPGSPIPGIFRQEPGVGCHFLLQCMKVKSESKVPQLCLDSQRPHGLQPTRLLHPWEFPSKSTGVGCYQVSIIFFFRIGAIYLQVNETKLLLKYLIFLYFQSNTKDEQRFGVKVEVDVQCRISEKCEQGKNSRNLKKDSHESLLSTRLHIHRGNHTKSGKEYQREL